MQPAIQLLTVQSHFHPHKPGGLGMRAATAVAAVRAPPLPMDWQPWGVEENGSAAAGTEEPGVAWEGNLGGQKEELGGVGWSFQHNNARFPCQ